MSTILTPADLLGNLDSAIHVAGFAVAAPGNLDAIRIFAARAARAGHWWAPVDSDSITADHIATPEAWAAARERLHAAAAEHSDWGGVEAPAWGAQLMHISAGGREVWGVTVDGDGVPYLVELRTRRSGDDVVVVAAAIRPLGHIHAGQMAAWVSRGFALRWLDGSGGIVQREHTSIADVDDVGPMLVTVGSGRPIAVAAPFAASVAYDRHMDNHLVSLHDVKRVEAALLPHVTALDLAVAQAGAEAGEAEAERQAREAAAWQAEWAARVGAIMAEADEADE